MLDWEMAYVGDPLEDLAWALAPNWRLREAPHLVAGVLDEADTVEAWTSVTRQVPDPDTLNWWRLFTHVKAITLWVSGIAEFTAGRTDDLVYGLFGWKNLGREELWMSERLAGAVST